MSKSNSFIPLFAMVWRETEPIVRLFLLQYQDHTLYVPWEWDEEVFSFEDEEGKPQSNISTDQISPLKNRERKDWFGYLVHLIEKVQ